VASPLTFQSLIFTIVTNSRALFRHPPENLHKSPEMRQFGQVYHGSHVEGWVRPLFDNNVEKDVLLCSGFVSQQRYR
jgi:hypothetical protein